MNTVQCRLPAGPQHGSWLYSCYMTTDVSRSDENGVKLRIWSAKFTNVFPVLMVTVHHVQQTPMMHRVKICQYRKDCKISRSRRNLEYVPCLTGQDVHTLCFCNVSFKTCHRDRAHKVSDSVVKAFSSKLSVNVMLYRRRSGSVYDSPGSCRWRSLKQILLLNTD